MGVVPRLLTVATQVRFECTRKDQINETKTKKKNNKKQRKQKSNYINNGNKRVKQEQTKTKTNQAERNMIISTSIVIYRVCSHDVTTAMLEE